MPKAEHLLRIVISLATALAPTGRWLACAAAVSAVELAARAVHQHGLWAHERFSWHARLALALASFLVVVGAAWPLHWAVQAACALRSRSRGLALFLSVATSLILCLALLTYAASWLALWRTGMFADGDAIHFGARNLGMLIHYLRQAEPALAACLLGAVIGAVGCSVVTCWPLAGGRNRPAAWRFGDGLIVIGLAASVVPALVVFYGDSPDGAEQTKEWWRDDRPGRTFAIAYRVNPIITAAAGRQLIGSDDIGIYLSPRELGPLRATSSGEIANTSPKVSLILIEIESLRSDILQLVHQGQEVMPALNRLAKNGLSFTRAYAASTHSNYADPALLSSLYPLRTTRHHYYSPADPWPKCLVYDVAKRHGCSTAVISSQNETWGGMEAFLKSPNLELLFDSRSVDVPTHVAESDITFARFATATRSAGKLDDRLTVARATEWIAECKRNGRPFCLAMNLQASHFPYVLPRDAARPFAPNDFDFFASFVSYPIEKVPVVKNAYYNALHYIDQQLATLVDYLDRSGLREKTLIVVIGDNGECFYENGYSTHAGPPFEPAIHVPLVMNCPGTIEPREEDYLTQAIDVVPTALALMGLPPSPCFQGTNVLAADRMPPERRIALVHNHTLVRATADAIITATGWKYVYDRKTKAGALYDLVADPGEQMPVHAKHPAVAATLHRILLRWRDVQLAYYARPDYYGIYYPPPPPRLSDADYDVLQR